MSTEQRGQERFSLNLQARISYRHMENESPVFDTVALNISSGGALVKTDHKFPMAAKVKIEFFLGFNDLKKLRFILSRESLQHITGKNIWVSATGIVIRQEGGEVGVIFDTNYQFTPIKISNSS